MSKILFKKGEKCPVLIFNISFKNSIISMSNVENNIKKLEKCPVFNHKFFFRSIILMSNVENNIKKLFEVESYSTVS
jgi:hypothetical protein